MELCDTERHSSTSEHRDGSKFTHFEGLRTSPLQASHVYQEPMTWRYVQQTQGAVRSHRAPIVIAVLPLERPYENPICRWSTRSRGTALSSGPQCSCCSCWCALWERRGRISGAFYGLNLVAHTYCLLLVRCAMPCRSCRRVSKSRKRYVQYFVNSPDYMLLCVCQDIAGTELHNTRSPYFESAP